MEREYIESEMIKSIGYDASTSTLEIEFNNGNVWQYYDFSESSWFEMRSYGSFGKYFHKYIKNHYSENRVG